MKTEFTVEFSGFRSIHQCKVVAGLYKCDLKHAREILEEPQFYRFQKREWADEFAKLMTEHGGRAVIGQSETPELDKGDSIESSSWEYLAEFRHPDYKPY